MAQTHDRASEIEYRVEIWATRRDGERLEAWSRELVGDEAAAAATVQVVTRLTRAGWTDLVILRNGRRMQLVQFQHAEVLGGAPEDLEKLEPGDELSQEEHDELDRLDDQGEDLHEAKGGEARAAELAPALLPDDDSEQIMLFR